MKRKSGRHLSAYLSYLHTESNTFLSIYLSIYLSIIEKKIYPSIYNFDKFYLSINLIFCPDRA